MARRAMGFGIKNKEVSQCLCVREWGRWQRRFSTWNWGGRPGERGVPGLQGGECLKKRGRQLTWKYLNFMRAVWGSGECSMLKRTQKVRKWKRQK